MIIKSNCDGALFYFNYELNSSCFVISAIKEVILPNWKLAALTEHVYTAYLLLSTANTLAFLNCLANMNDNTPLPHPKSKIVDGFYFKFYDKYFYNNFKYVSVVGSQMGPWGNILFLPNNKTCIPFFLYSSNVISLFI